jgi:CelD/BcsL family acetyltransferase involved in cellulose biosynthesis
VSRVFCLGNLDVKSHPPHLRPLDNAPGSRYSMPMPSRRTSAGPLHDTSRRTWLRLVSDTGRTFLRRGERRYEFSDLGVGVQVVTSRDGLSALRPDYERLNAIAHNGLPFLLHDWHLAWWEHFPNRSATIRDDLRVFVVRQQAGACVGIVPFVLTRRPGVRGIGVGVLNPIGADPYLTELRMPLVDPDHAALCARAVLRALDRDPSWDWIVWDGTNQVPAFQAVLADAAPLTDGPSMPDHLMDLAPTWEEFRTGLKRNIRESLRHCYNSLKRDGIEFELKVAATPDEVRDALPAFLELHAKRAAVKEGVAHPDRFQGEAAKAFLHSVAERLADRGLTRIFTLHIAGRPAASRMGFMVGESLYLYYSGFDPAFGKYSIMTTTTAEAIKYAISQGLKTVNLSAGTDVSKSRWGARVLEFSEATQVRDRARSRLAYRIFRAAVDHDTAPAWLRPMLAKLPKRAWT